ncbi:MAG TPA: PKD domain-containing protein, partial [Candidatus Thermoplasmatota archaeon]|nr:PKD domain-containing protein [Candidatus Thermoplasmatota archaeon]
MPKDTLRAVTVVLLLGVAALAMAQLQAAGPLQAAALPPASADAQEQALPSAADMQDSLHALRFEPNVGQAPPEALFVARGAQHVLVTTTGVTAFAGAWVTLRFADTPVAAVPERPMGSTASYFLGDEAAAWQPAVPQYAAVRLVGVAPGIDVLVHSQDGQLRFDHLLAAGADPQRAGFTVEGGLAPRAAEDGSLALGSGTPLVLAPPRLYQDLPTGRVPVEGSFRVEGDRVGYVVGAYDPSHPLVIDPVLRHATFLGGNGNDIGYRVAARSGAGSMRHVYIVGTRCEYFYFYADCDYSWGGVYTAPPGFTVRQHFGAVGTGMGLAHDDAFVMKLDYDYVTRTVTRDWIAYIGGANMDHGFAIAVAPNGEVWAGGKTLSTNFPVANGIQSLTDNRGYFDGNVRSDAGFHEGWIVRLSADGSQLLMGSLLGSGQNDVVRGLALDGQGNLLVVGDASNSYAYQVPFPVRNAAQLAHADGPLGSAVLYEAWDGFVAKVDVKQSPPTLVFATFLGGRYDDHARAVAADAQGNVYVAGMASDGAVFPTTPGAFRQTGTWYEAFVAKYSPTGTRLWTTLLGGSSDDEAFDMAVEAGGKAWVVGSTYSSNFPVCGTGSTAPCSAPAIDTQIGGQDAFVVAVDADGASLSYASFLGGTTAGASTWYSYDTARGVAFDPASGHVTVVGGTQATDFPTSGLQPASQSTKPSTSAWQYNGFITRIDPASATPVFSSYIGGGSESWAMGVAVDDRGVTYVAGYTGTAFQTTSPVQATTGGMNDVFLSVFGKRPPTAAFDATPQGQPKVSVPTTTTMSFLSLTPLSLERKTSAGDLPVATLAWTLTGPNGLAWQAATSTPSVPGSVLVPGSYQLCLTATDSEWRLPLADHTHTRCVELNVANRPPTVSLEAPETVATGQVATITATATDLDGEVLSYEWDFGDGNTATSSAATVTHVYAAAGAHTVTVTALDDGGKTASASATIQVRRPPTAAFTVTTPAYAGFPVFFTDASTAGSLAIQSWSWDFGDGTFEGRNPPPRLYAQEGTYDVRLTVSNAVGTSTHAVKLAVKSASPAPVDDAHVTYRDTPLRVEAPGLLANDENPHGIQLAMLVNAQPARGTLEWDPDGSFTYVPAPGFLGEDAFTYTVTGARSNGVVRIAVQEFPPPEAGFVAAVEGGAVAFTDTSRPGFKPIVAWEWDFGDGWRSYEQNPRHAYRGSAPYLVELTVTDAGGLSASAYMVLDVEAGLLLDGPAPGGVTAAAGAGTAAKA